MRYWMIGILAIAVVAAVYAYGSFAAQAQRIGRPNGECVMKSDTEWQESLTPEQFRVTRRKGTERAFTGEYWNCHDDGIFTCVCCGQPLFDAKTKYDSG